jgi:phosphomannomutase
MSASIKPFSERKLPGVICMFDVDGTLTPARRSATPEILAALKKLREYTAVAIVGGSDFNKIKEQLQEPGLECEWGKGGGVSTVTETNADGAGS